jgi:AcrR family transcriptional regulator
MTTPQAPRRDRRAERHQSTRTEIREAVWALTEARGLAGWSLRDVADAVGMRAPSLYVYFDSKSALYDALFADGYRELLVRISAADRSGTPTEVLHRAARMFFDFAVEQPARYALLFLRTLPGFVPSEQSYALAQRVVDEISVVLTDAGAPGPEALDLYTALLTGLASQQVSNDPGGTRWARLVDEAVEMFLASRGRVSDS